MEIQQVDNVLHAYQLVKLAQIQANAQHVIQDMNYTLIIFVMFHVLLANIETHRLKFV